jgi:AraC-like DNA-binding protein
MTVQLDGKDHLLTYEKSPYSQWIYLSNIDRGQISKDSRQIGWTTLYISLALFALTFILTLTGSRFVYEPVGKLYEYVARFGGKTELSSGTDELQRIRLVFESLLDKQNKLDKELFGHTSQLDELFTMKLLLGKVRAGDIWDSLQHFGHATEWQERYVVVIQIDSWEDTLYDERDRNLLMFAINNIVEELIPKETRIKPVYMDMHQVTLVGNTDPGSGDFNAYIDSLYDKIQTSIKNVLKIKVSIGISRPFFDWFYAPKAYEEGTEALKYRIILDEESIVRIEDVRPDRHKTYEYPDNLESELISVIKTGNLLMAEKHLVLFTQEVVRQKLDHKEYQMMLLRLLIRLLQVNDSIKEPISPTGAVYTEFLNLRTVNEMEEWLKVSLIEPLIQFVKQASDEQHRTISRQVMDLVGAMYDKPLTLEACAAQLNYNSSYISKVFRKETGIKFIDYLQTHRMNVAKQWLVETDMKISQIAERLQYNNAQNFIRYFRRTEGMTPGQYREQNQ